MEIFNVTYVLQLCVQLFAEWASHAVEHCEDMEGIRGCYMEKARICVWAGSQDWYKIACT